MKVKIKLEHDQDEVVIELPNGNEVSLVLSDIEDGALPELDILFNQRLTANLYKRGLIPSVPYKKQINALDFVQIIVPLNQYDNL